MWPSEVADLFVLTRVLGKFLFEVKPTDPVTLMAVAAILAATGILAGLLPARGATRVDPVVALDGNRLQANRG